MSSRGSLRGGLLAGIGSRPFGRCGLLSYLSEVGVMGEEDPPALSAVEALVSGYRQWLIADRGLAAMTVLRYETLARRFLTERVTATDELGVTGLDGAVVSRFLLGECNRVCLGSAKGKVAELRSLLRFLRVRGLTAPCLLRLAAGLSASAGGDVRPAVARLTAAIRAARLALSPSVKSARAPDRLMDLTRFRRHLTAACRRLPGEARFKCSARPPYPR
jgi:integrase/recombinase XerD